MLLLQVLLQKSQLNVLLQKSQLNVLLLQLQSNVLGVVTLNVVKSVFPLPTQKQQRVEAIETKRQLLRLEAIETKRGGSKWHLQGVLNQASEARTSKEA